MTSDTASLAGRTLSERISGLSPEKRALLDRLLEQQQLLDNPAREAADASRAPLSFGQQRLWFLDQLEPGSSAFNITSALRLTGELNVDALRRSFSLIVERHEVLRTAFVEELGVPVARVRPACPLDIPVIEVAGSTGTEREEAAEALLREQAALPFDLTSGDLLRLRLARLSASDHVLGVTVHHIAFDAWSVSILFNELFTAYEAFRVGEGPDLPELRLQYQELARQERRRLSADQVEATLDYWREQLDELPRDLVLPTDRPRGLGAIPTPGRQATVVPETVARAVKELGRQEGATLFMTLLAAFNLLLHRFSGRDDIVVGTPVAGRHRAEARPLIGFFVNNLVLRTDLSGELTFRELLGRVREVSLAAFAHQEVPFEKLVEVLEPERALSRNPLFQVVFTLQPAPSSTPSTLGVRPVRVDAAAVRYDLEFYTQESADGLKLWCLFDQNLFEEDTVARLLQQFQDVLAEVVVSPAAPLSRLALLSSDDRESLVRWNRTEKAYPGTESLSRLFERVVAKHGPRVAVEADDGVTLTYHELDERANRLAHFLRRRGVGPEVAVGLCLERGPSMIVSMLAVVKAGGAYVPLDPDYPEARLAFMLEDAGLSLVLTQECLAGKLPESPCPLVSLDAAASSFASEPATSPGCAGSPEDLLYVMYTSGSTGRPKGVEVTGRAVARLLFGVDYVTLGPGETLLALAPPSFDASTFEIWGALLHGGRLVLYPDRLPTTSKLAKVIAERRVTTLWLTGALFNAIVDEDPSALAGCRQVVAGGEALSVTHVSRAQSKCPATRFVNGYGPTEGTTFSCCYPIPDLAGGAWVSIPIGSPIANTSVHVLDRRLEPVPVGAVGELYIGGDGLARGYRARPAMTAERFVPAPEGAAGERLYRTGDRARFRRDGRLEFLGRIDEQVKLRGFRVEPGEVEAALKEVSDVRDAAVVVRELPSGDRRLVAYWVPSTGGTLDAHELRRRLSRRLPEYMIPGGFVRLDELPLTVSGKLDRLALPEPNAAGDGEFVFTPPRGPIEEALAEIWQDVLALPRTVGVEEDFFALGGHSLLATRLVARVRETLKVDLPLRVLFETPTIAALAAQVERGRGTVVSPADALPLERIPRGGELPLTFSQHRLWFLEELLPGSSAYNVAGALRLLGRLEADVLARSLSAIVARHESLRSSFGKREGRAVLRILPPRPHPLPFIDLTPLEQAAGEGEAERIAAENAIRPFDLSSGDVFRTTLLRLGEHDHVLLLAMHHIVSDAWSLGVLTGELGAFYRALHAGEPVLLPELHYQVVDHAAWQRRWLAGERLERELGYWRERLSAVSPVELPTDRPRPAIQTFRGARRTAHFPRALHEGLERLGRERSATLFMTLLAAFQALLARISGRHDVVVGTPIANRRRREVEGLIGFFANNLVMRADLSADPTFSELLESVRNDALDAYDHQDLPFDKLVDELSTDRNLSHNPLFQVTFSLQTAPTEKLELPGITLGRLPVEPRRTRFDLELNLWRRADGLSVVAFYNADLFDAATIDRTLSQYRRVLEAVALEPTRRISELPLLAPDEREKILGAWKAHASQPHDTPCDSLHVRFERCARQHPDAVALVDPGESGTGSGPRLWTYRELDEQSNRWAHRLRHDGAGPESVVALCMQRSGELVVAVLAVLKSGAAYLPLDPDYPQERLRFLLGEAAPGIIVADRAGAEKLPEVPGTLLRIDVDAADTDEASGQRLEAQSLPDHPAYVIYTSGSTGRPKGVEVTHANVLRLMDETSRWFAFGPDDAIPLFHSFAFDFSVWEMWSALLFGGRLVVVPYWVSRSPDAFLDLVREQKVTVLNQTPSAFRHFARAEEALAPDALSLRCVVFGGEALHLENLRAWLERHGSDVPRLVNMYGITETTVHVTYRPIEHPDLETPWRSVIGRPIADLSLYILDEVLEPVPPGVAGELYIGGAGVARGYRNRPELTAERFVPDPFGGTPGGRLYRSGDLARYRADGEIEYAGRRDQQVKIRGFRIELGEIEACLSGHPSLSDAVVIARDNTEGHRQIVAYVVPVPGVNGAGLESDLRAYASARLPDYMVPASLVAVDRLPVTAHGKLDRERLLERTPLVTDVLRTPPSTESERLLAGIWAEVLGHARVSVEDNFFELGGDSILSIQVVARANEAGLALKARDVFQHQTLSALARRADEVAQVDVESSVAPSSTGPFPLTPIQSWFFGAAPEEPHHYNQSILFELASEVRPDAVQYALDAIAARHDVFRLRFRREGGKWRQDYGRARNAAMVRVDLSALPHEARPAAVERGCAAAQTSLDLAAGPLARWVFFDLGSENAPRLLWVLHHLTVDGVSWRILLDDFRRDLERSTRGEPLSPRRTTTPFGIWAEHLSRYAAMRDLDEERAFWSFHGEPGETIPVDFPGGRNEENALEHVRSSLGEESTRRLLQELPKRYRSRIDEVLLTAVSAAMHHFTGQDAFRIHVEGHGREELFDEIDLSRTVGWFTGIYPLRFAVARGSSLHERLEVVKQALRAVPRKGIGYGVLRYLGGLATGADPETSFNYLGQLGDTLDASALFRPGRESVGPMRSPRTRRRHLLDVSAVVASGKLQMDWMYARTVHRRETVERLAKHCLLALEELVEGAKHTDLPRAPSDFDLVTLDAERLGRLAHGAGAALAIEDIHPLSPLQEGMLFHGLYAPQSRDYVVQVSWRLEGPLDVEAFERAWNDVVGRHTILRTSFDWESGAERLAIVHRDVQLPFTCLDWRDVEGEAAEARLETFLAEDQSSPLSPERAPLLRVAVVRLSEETYHFTWTFHHLLLDGWSLGRVLKEVFTCYESRRAGRPASLAPAIPFRDYIAWLERKDADASAAYWRDTLQGFDAPTPLGLDEKGEASRTGHEDRSILLTPKLSDALRAFSREHKLTLSTLFQGCWAYLLSRYSGEKDVVFGSTVSGRPAELAGVESMVGLFINTLPMRVAVRDDAPVTAWLDELQRSQAEAREHAHTPLVDIQGVSDVPRGLPLFESIFVFENFPADRRVGSRGASLRASGFQFWTHTNYPLHFRVRPGREIALDLNYDCRRFAAATAERVLDHFLQTLESMVARPRGRVENLLVAESPVSPAPESPLRPGGGFEPLKATMVKTSIGAWFGAVAAKHPDRPAVVSRDDAWSYATLEARAHRLAHRFATLPDGGGRVALLFGHGAPMIAGMLGVLEAGRAYVPLDPRYPRERLQYILEDAEVEALVTDAAHADLGHELAAGRIPVWPFDDDDDDEYEDVMSPRPSDRDRRNGVSASSLAYLLYTSGSTGKPKGTMQSHENVLHHACNYANALGIGPEDRLTLLSSYAFDASVMSIWGALATGASVHPFDLRERHITELAPWIEEQGITLFHSTPTVFRYFLDALRGDERFSLLRAVVLGGEEVTRNDVERFRAHFPRTSVLVNGLGPTESTVSLQFFIDHDSPLPVRRVPVGYPVPGVEAWLLDADGRRAPFVGEIALRGRQVALGYWNKAAETNAAFSPDPDGGDRRLYRTGDLGRFRADGALEFLGRKDFRVKLRGHRIEPGEIEAVLGRVPGVRECVTVLVNDAQAPRLVAFIVAARGNGLDEATLREATRRELPEVMVPSAFVFLETMPMTPTGKIDRRALPSPMPGSSPSLAVAPVAPRSPIEEDLVEIWRSVLKRDDIGVRDSFFDLGGHSLLATQVALRIREVFDIELPLRWLFEKTTIEELALAVLERLLEEGPEPDAQDLLSSARADEVPSREEPA